MDRKETEIRAGGDSHRAGGGGQGTRVDTLDPGVSRFESLLRQGEEHFSAGHYERSIHVWTRVLFLERANAEARQGIDRAKRALAEQLRVLDASVAEARRLFDEGKPDAAKEVVHSVLRVDPRHAEACGLDAEIAARQRQAEPTPSSTASDLEPPAAGTSPRGVVLRVSRPRAPRPKNRRRASRWQMAAFATIVALGFTASGFVLHANWEHLVSGAALTRSAGFAPEAALAPAPAEVPSLSELFYYNGARLFEKGRYREALRELGRVERDAAVADDARRLILRIEERLLRGASGPGSGSEASDASVPPVDDEGRRP